MLLLVYVYMSAIIRLLCKTIITQLLYYYCLLESTQYGESAVSIPAAPSESRVRYR